MYRAMHIATCRRASTTVLSIHHCQSLQEDLNKHVQTLPLQTSTIALQVQIALLFISYFTDNAGSIITNICNMIAIVESNIDRHLQFYANQNSIIIDICTSVAEYIYARLCNTLRVVHNNAASVCNRTANVYQYVTHSCNHTTNVRDNASVAILRAMHVFARMENPLGPRLPPKGFSISRIITRIIGALQKTMLFEQRRGPPSSKHHDSRGPPPCSYAHGPMHRHIHGSIDCNIHEYIDGYSWHACMQLHVCHGMARCGKNVSSAVMDICRVIATQSSNIVDI